MNEMKRLALTIAAILAGVLAFAQSLEGTWTGKMAMDDNSQGADVAAKGTGTYTFAGDTFTEKMLVVIDMSTEKDGKSVTMKVTITGSNSGTWTRKGDVLTLTPDKKSKPVVDVKVEGIPSFLAGMLSGPIKKELNKSLKEVDQMKIISLTDKELVIEDILTEKEKKSGAKVERITLTKK